MTSQGGLAGNQKAPTRRGAGGAKRSKRKSAAVTREEVELLVDGLRKMLDRATGAHYPPILADLLAEAGLERSRATAVIRNSSIGRHLVTTAKRNSSLEAACSSWVALADDAPRLAASEQVLVWTLDQRARNVGKAHTVADLACELPGKLQSGFKIQWNDAIRRGHLPQGVAGIRASRTTYLFREQDLIGSRRVLPASDESSAEGGESASATSSGPKKPTLPATPPTPPAEEVNPEQGDDTLPDRILRAFSEVDARSGGNNYVLLFDLRRALSDVERPHFDEAVAELRRQRRLSLDAADGRHQRIEPDALAAGIVEEGQTLVYAQRRGA